MNRKTFIKETTKLIKTALLFAKKVKMRGVSSLEDEVEDLDDEDFKAGLRMIIDGVDIRIVDEILSNKLSFVKNEHTRIYKTIAKRTVIGLHEGLSVEVLLYVLLSLAGFSRKEQREAERTVMIAIDDYAQENYGDDGDAEDMLTDGLDSSLAEEIKKRLYDFDEVVRLGDRSIQKVFRDLDSDDLAKALKPAGKKARGVIFRNLSKRAASMLKEDMEYMGPIHISVAEEAYQKIIDIIRRLEEAGELDSDNSDDLDLD